jgi:hypothetical protein
MQMLRGKRYRLRIPTIAVRRDESDGRKIACVIPERTTVEIVEEPDPKTHMLMVAWDDKLAQMFVVDLRERGQEMRAASA